MDLKLDLERLKKLNADLVAIRQEFEGADDFSDTVAHATGHDGLAGAVHDFAHAWNEKRPKMAQSVKDLEQKLSAITDGFTQLDTQLAQSMEQLIQQENAAASGKPAPLTAPSTAGPRRTN